MAIAVEYKPDGTNGLSARAGGPANPNPQWRRAEPHVQAQALEYKELVLTESYARGILIPQCDLNRGGPFSRCDGPVVD